MPHTLWFPFRLPPGQNFNRELSTAIECRADSFNFAIGEKNGVYFMRVAGFKDETTARGFIPRAHAALMWVALKQNLSPEYSLDVQRAHFPQDPDQAGRNLARSFGIDPEKFGPVDCFLDTAFPAIYPDGSAVRFITAGGVTVLQSYAPDQTLELLREASLFARAERVLADSKLSVGLDLYKGVIRESSAKAKFLTLVMALEALAPDERKPPVAQQLIDEWMEIVKVRQSNSVADSDEWNAYEALQRELGFRKEASIRQRIRTLVRSTLSQHGDADADAMAKTALKIYDQRSKLVHDGYLPEGELSQATEQARNIVRRVLEARFIATAR